MTVYECNTKRISHLTTHRYTPHNVTLNNRLKPIPYYHIFFIVLYMALSYWLIATSGTPYKQFLQRAERDGFDVMEGSTAMKEAFVRTFAGINDPGRKDVASMGWSDFWAMDDIEETAELKRQKALLTNEASILSTLPSHMKVPSKYVPTFNSMLVTGVVIVLHLLVSLMQIWSIRVNLRLNYTEMDLMQEVDEQVLYGQLSVEEYLTTHQTSHYTIVVQPSDATKKTELRRLSYSPTLGLSFTYNHIKFAYNPQTGVFHKMSSPKRVPFSVLANWRGLSEVSLVEKSRERFGLNKVQVEQDSFIELYKKQLVSPFTVFQLFCTLLWTLDSYITYSLFSLFMILTFEGSVVFQKMKSASALTPKDNEIKPNETIDDQLSEGKASYVYRENRWQVVNKTELLPGDLAILADVKNQKHLTVPADCVLLSGSAIANEASLTGESVPQRKEVIHAYEEAQSNDNAVLDKELHKRSLLYAGTTLLQIQGEESAYNNIVPPKDLVGAFVVVYVLRTGFSNTQGKLVRLMEASSNEHNPGAKEVYYLLLFLFTFALASSGYVLTHAPTSYYQMGRNRNVITMSDNGDEEDLSAGMDPKVQYKLLLHCILILTSVIPPELPMQMALAVNTSLLTLMKLSIFCTEPNKIPSGGKLTLALFDKTGTLTTDELVCVGVEKLRSNSSNTAPLEVMHACNDPAGLVVAGCHTLFLSEGKISGDPLELASLKALNWTVKNESGEETVVPAAGTEKYPERAGKALDIHGEKVDEIKILHRCHFSSKLQRMSCVIRANGKTFAVAKGSPEVIGQQVLMNKPNCYDDRAMSLAKEGYRVIALAFKEFNTTDDYSKVPRSDIESAMTFVGFIAFTCRVRKDTKNVLEHLQDGGMKTIMVTGDALFTAIHVAKEVSICSPSSIELVRKNPEIKGILILDDTATGLSWTDYNDGRIVEPYDASTIPKLSFNFELATTGKNLIKALEVDAGTKSMLHNISVFARMTPDLKEAIIAHMQAAGHLCLMCGDGANDVGALKSADVGIALLSGFGDVNVDKGDKEVHNNANVTSIVTKDQLEDLKKLPVRQLKDKIRALGTDPDKYASINTKEDLVSLYRVKASEVAVKQHDRKNAVDKMKTKREELIAKRKLDTAEQQRRLQQRIQELEAQGESWAAFKAMKEFWAEQAAKNKEMKKQTSTVEGSAAKMLSQLEDLELDEVPSIKIGDASIAAPFTSKMPSIRSCVDVVRQGRCTLVTSIQMNQILALNSLISAYSLSVLYLDGVKYGDTQMTAMGILMSISYMSMSRSKPLDRLSNVRPIQSIFHPSLFLSLLGQFTVHLGTMMWAVRRAKAYLPPDHDIDLDGEFRPGIVNSVVFLVNNVQQVSVFVVNLQGRPFMTGLTENRALLWSLVVAFFATFMFANESVPSLNKYMQLVPFPEDHFRNFIMKILVSDILICLTFDRLMKLIFAPEILFASLKGTTLKDVMSLGRTVAVIYFLMKTLLGDNEQWEEMLREEGRMDELGLNFTNSTEQINMTPLGAEL